MTRRTVEAEGHDARTPVDVDESEGGVSLVPSIEHESAEHDSTENKRPPRGPVRALRALGPPAAMLAVVLAGLMLPLRGSRIFYFWDDTAAAAAGVWQKVGESVLGGEFPLLVVEMWRGGNFVAEAATGMFNPVMLGLMVATHPLDDFAVALTISKMVLFAIMAIGLFLLARSYGANPWPAAVAGMIVPLSGYTLYTDGSAWINGLAVTAFVPLAWWGARRFLWQGGSALVAVLCGYLLISTGNPYSLLALLTIAIALGVELLFSSRARSLPGLVVQMGSAALLGVIVYLPFVLTSGSTGRADQPTTNNEFLSPGLSDFLGISFPSYQPYIQGFGAEWLPTPALYLAWFVLPLLPWLRWRAAFVTWRRFSGVMVFGLISLLFVLGPSQAWMFRMPIRLVPMVLVAVALVFAIVASHGVQKDRVPQRASISVGLILVGFWQAWSDKPDAVDWHVRSLAILFVFTGLFIVVRSFGPKGFAVLAGGMLVVLFAQTHWMPINGGFYNFSFPHSRSELQQQFADRSDGTVFQIASLATIQPYDMKPDRAWRDLAFGNNYSIADVESLTAYSGIGLKTHDNALCLTYYGGACPEAWQALWKVPDGATQPVADLLRISTVVVQKNFVEITSVPDGWRLGSSEPFADTYVRETSLPDLGGRVSVAGPDVTIDDHHLMENRREELSVSAGSGPDADRQITFDRLAWLGYSATVDGEEVEVGEDPVGLLTVVVPAGADDARVVLTFTPPGWNLGLALAALGALSAIALQLATSWSGRKERK